MRLNDTDIALILTKALSNKYYLFSVKGSAQSKPRYNISYILVAALVDDCANVSALGNKRNREQEPHLHYLLISTCPPSLNAV